MCDFEEEIYNDWNDFNHKPKNDHGEIGSVLELTIEEIGRIIPMKNCSRYQIANMKARDKEGKIHSFPLWDEQCDLIRKGDVVLTKILSPAQHYYYFERK